VISFSFSSRSHSPATNAGAWLSRLRHTFRIRALIAVHYLPCKANRQTNSMILASHGTRNGETEKIQALFLKYCLLCKTDQHLIPPIMTTNGTPVGESNPRSNIYTFSSNVLPDDHFKRPTDRSTVACRPPKGCS